MTVYVIVLNWNGADDTIACLQSLARLEGPLPKVIVCDNGSSDDSYSKLQAFLREPATLDVALVQTGANLGFSGGNNVGLRKALADPEMAFAWVLNNDTTVAPEALKFLLHEMRKNPHIGICGSTLLYLEAPEMIQAVGGKYNAWLGLFRHMLGHQTYTRERCLAVNPKDFDYVVGASMFVRRTVLETIGLLSEDYFLYAEEIDWATRLKREMPDFELGYAPDSLVYHREGAATGANERQKKTTRYFADYFFITSRLRFTRKFYPFRRGFVQMTMLGVAINRLRRNQPRSALLALCAFMGFVPKALDPRRPLRKP